ncbi:hypothetical protein H0H87_009617, partial [Tephrocybe sp. NHM501043]
HLDVILFVIKARGISSRWPVDKAEFMLVCKVRPVCPHYLHHQAIGKLSAMQEEAPGLLKQIS